MAKRRSMGLAPSPGLVEAAGDSGSRRVPAKLSIRLDAPTREGLEAFMAKSHMNVSQAMRTAMAMGLRDSGALEDSFIAAATREGMMRGLALFRDRIQVAIGAVLDDIEASR